MRPQAALAALAALLFTPMAAAAQPPASGPMTIERLHSGFLGGPDVKVTDVDGHTSVLVGGQGGWIADDTIFVGAAGYWLANGSHDREMGTADSSFSGWDAEPSGLATDCEAWWAAERPRSPAPSPFLW